MIYKVENVLPSVDGAGIAIIVVRADGKLTFFEKWSDIENVKDQITNHGTITIIEDQYQSFVGPFGIFDNASNIISHLGDRFIRQD